MNSFFASLLVFALLGVAMWLLDTDLDRAGACVVLAVLCALFEERY